MLNFVELTIKSKNKNSLKKFLLSIKKIAKNKTFRLNNFCKIIQKRKKSRIFSVLKSPHANKKAQEQFKTYIFSKKMRLNTFQIIKYLIILKRMQHELFTDVQFELKFLIKAENNKFLNYEFGPNKLQLVPKFGFFNKQFNLYLTLINFYGKYVKRC